MSGIGLHNSCVCLVLVLGGCDAGRSDRPDAGNKDAFGEQEDAHVVGARDAGCTADEYEKSCMGRFLRSCVNGRPTDMRCPRNQVCLVIDGEPTCGDGCEANRSSCSEDGRSLITCNEHGTESTTTPCPLGCSSFSGGRAAACGWADPCEMLVPPIAFAGERLAVNLCAIFEATNAQTNQTAPECPAAASGNERIISIDVDRNRRLIVDAEREGDLEVDPVIYLRTHCDQQASQHACGDDVSWDPLNRNSHLEAMVDPGRWYLVVDSFSVCGLVNVTIRLEDG